MRAPQPHGRLGQRGKGMGGSQVDHARMAEAVLRGEKCEISEMSGEDMATALEDALRQQLNGAAGGPQDIANRSVLCTRVLTVICIHCTSHIAHRTSQSLTSGRHDANSCEGTRLTGGFLARP
jgi:hypothetical protein